MRVPLATNRLDPHDLFDPLAAVFAPALTDPVYALDRRGKPYPTLAAGFPRREHGQTVVKLRAGLRSARGKKLTGRDLAWSVERTRKMGASGWLANIGTARIDHRNPLVVRFGKVDPTQLAVSLSSPLLALLPRGFAAKSPDGTGAFVGRCSASRLDMIRNRKAARGASYLNRIIVNSAPNLSASLRAFEAGTDDIGWLGTHLFRIRTAYRKFDLGSVGWVVLATGKQAGSFGAPGVAQQLANAVPIERLAHLALQGRSGGPGPSTNWGGGPCTLWVQSGCPHLKTIADTVATRLSKPGHEVTVSQVSVRRLEGLRKSGDYHLMIHFVRRVAAGPVAALIALATADRPALGRDVARHRPRLAASTPAHRLTRTLRVGVLGSLRVWGGAASGVYLVRGKGQQRGFALGDSYRL